MHRPRQKRVTRPEQDNRAGAHRVVALRKARRGRHVLRPLAKAVAPAGKPRLERQRTPLLQIWRSGLRRPHEDVLRACGHSLSHEQATTAHQALR